MAMSHNPFRAPAVFVAAGVALLAWSIAVALLSFRFPYGASLADMPLGVFVVLCVAGGLSTPALAIGLKSVVADKRMLAAMLAIGLAMRVVLAVSPPVLEDDSYRYLWDGAATAAGVDPYAHAPADAAPYDVFGVLQPEAADPGLAKLQAIARDHPLEHGRINYPYVKTIYPPIVQGAFAAAHVVAPFDLGAWKAVLILVDLLAVALLVGALRAYGRSPLWAALYWWNPVVLVQGFGAGHMDVLLTPFLVGSLWLAKLNRPVATGAVLAGAAAVKVWPILLAPALARRWLGDLTPTRLILFAVVFLVATALLLAPQLRHIIDPDAGLAVYSEQWRRNAFLFAILEDAVFAAFEEPGRIARIAVAGGVGLLAIVTALRSSRDGGGAPTAALAATAALIFLSPTGYPWYFIWLAGLLPFVPNLGLTLLSATAPLYYLRFPLGDDNPLFQWGLVPIAFGLPLALAIISAIQSRTEYRRIAA